MMKAIVIAGVVLCLVPMCRADGESTCSGLVEAHRQSRLNDQRGESYFAEFSKAYDLLRGCKSRFCVVTMDYSTKDSEPHATRLSSAESFSELASSGSAESILAVGRFKNRKFGGVCLLAEYSGGSAAAWLYEGKTQDGKYQTVYGGGPSLDGDSMRPSEIINSMDYTQKHTAWERVGHQR